MCTALDRSPGALYPTNRALRASQRLVMPRFVGDMDEGEKEAKRKDEMVSIMSIVGLEISQAPKLGCCHMNT
jgi:hypothetical protein